VRAPALAAAAVVLVTAAACGGQSAQQSLPPPSPTTAPSPAATVVAQTDLGPLPAPGTLADLQRRTVGMPDTLAGAGRAQSPPEQVRYLGDDAEFGIEVSEAADLYPDLETTAEAMPRLREQLSSPQSCGQPPSHCLRGSSEGSPAVIWGHDDSPLLFVAIAPDEATLTELLDAWRAGS
jgi:hypothetical protein